MAGTSDFMCFYWRFDCNFWSVNAGGMRPLKILRYVMRERYTFIAELLSEYRRRFAAVHSEAGVAVAVYCTFGELPMIWPVYSSYFSRFRPYPFLADLLFEIFIATYIPTRRRTVPESTAYITQRGMLILPKV